MLSESYYAQNYAGITGLGLGTSACKIHLYNYYAQEQEYYYSIVVRL